MRLNVGCGKDILDGWENVDLFPTDPRVMPLDIRAVGLAYTDCVEAIRAIDVLEHIPRKEVLPTLKGWWNVLKSGGTVEIRCPDVRKQAELLLNGTWPTDKWAHMTFGGQDAPGNFHNAGFCQQSLAVLLREAGFVNIKSKPEHEDVPIDGNANFRIFAQKP